MAFYVIVNNTVYNAGGSAEVTLAVGESITITASGVGNWIELSSNYVTYSYNGTTSVTVTGKTNSGTNTDGIFAMASDNSGAVRIQFTVTGSGSTTTVPVEGVTVSPRVKTLTVGATYTLTAIISPSNATNQSVTWTSTNSSVASVGTSTGVVTAKAVGTATIRCTTRDGGYVSTCSITVQAATISVTSVSLDKSTASVEVGSTITLYATVYPTNATNRSVTWKSDSTSIATVTSSGVVKGISAGSTWIRVTTVDGGYTKACYVTVTAKSVSVTGVTVSPSSVTINIGKTYSLTATVSPSNATNKTVSWVSGNTSIATVTSSGVVKGVSAGSVIITATTSDGGYESTCSVTVLENVAISLNVDNPLEITIGAENQTVIVADVTPTSVSNTDVTFELVDTNGIIRVDYTSNIAIVIWGDTPGTAYLNVISDYDPSVKVTLQINVVAAEFIPITSLTLSVDTINVKVEDGVEISAIIVPNNATTQGINWTIQNTDIASLNVETNIAVYVKCLHRGITTVTASTTDGSNISATATIVIDPKLIIYTGSAWIEPIPYVYKNGVWTEIKIV